MKILITGASSGIGAACAKKFADNGHSLILVARRADRLASMKSTYKHCEIFVQDICDLSSLEKTIKENKKLFEGVDVVINNAGLALGLNKFQDAKIEELETMIDTNFKGLVFISKLILPFFIAKNSGHIINLGSVAARWNYPQGHIYCATKSAVHTLTTSMRYDLLGTNIRVSEISPGMVETEFSEVRLGDKDKAKKVYAGMKPLSPEDVAESIYWMSQQPAHVNIQELVIYPTAQAAPGFVHRD
jgi:NADP-dependent 3-hydroxy acid dehydrogenase YdfG